MKWGAFFATAVVILAIFLFQWPKMKTAPKWDKWAFCLLLLTGWGLSMFDLRHMTGPTAWVEAIFSPLGKWMGL